MPVPADVIRRKLREQMKNLDHDRRTDLLQKTLDELPGFTSGPYGKLRNWIKDQMRDANTRARVEHRESFMVKKEGDRTAALIGSPNSGKSSLLRALTGSRVRVGHYPFTTLKPVAGIVKVSGAVIQLVEVPGLLEGAAGGVGNGRAYLAAARAADIGVFVTELSEHGVEQFLAVCKEVEGAGIDLPRFIVANKSDMDGADSAFVKCRRHFPDEEIVSVSTTTGVGLDSVRDALWRVASLVRVFPRANVGGQKPGEAIILAAGSTVAEFAETIHRDLREDLVHARVWGDSARFAGQPVSPDHVLLDGDRVLLKTR